MKIECTPQELKELFSCKVKIDDIFKEEIMSSIIKNAKEYTMTPKTNLFEV